MTQMQTPFVAGKSPDAWLLISENTPRASSPDFAGADLVPMPVAFRPGARMINLTAPEAGDAVTVSAVATNVVVFEFDRDDVTVFGVDNMLVVRFADGAVLNVANVDPAVAKVLWAETGEEVPMFKYFLDPGNEGARFDRFDPSIGIGGLQAIGGLDPTALQYAGFGNGGNGREFVDELDNQVAALPPLFTPNLDIVNFANIFAGTYLDGTQYDALESDDQVSLPLNAAIAAQAGYDLLHDFHGNDGNDAINGSVVGDKIFGDAGNDTIFGGDGGDTLNGGTGGDFLYGEGGNDIVIGGEGDDVLEGGAGQDQITGGVGADTIMGGTEGDIISGGDGVDNIHGDQGNDFMNGDAGNDQLFGDDGIDFILGGAGGDYISGGAGDDEIHAGDGDDGPLNAVSVFGDAGNDTIFGEGGNDELQGGDGDDILDGGVGEDRLFGDAGNDTLDGGDGNDILVGSAGDDTITGGAGNDFLEGDVGNDTLNGGAGNDIFIGGVGHDIMNGGAGVDNIAGQDGDDTIAGGAGADVLTGGNGADIFAFAAGDGGNVLDQADVIQDFQDGTDLFQIDNFDINNLVTQQNGLDAVLIYNGEFLAVVKNTQIADITAADFVP